MMRKADFDRFRRELAACRASVQQTNRSLIEDACREALKRVDAQDMPALSLDGLRLFALELQGVADELYAAAPQAPATLAVTAAPAAPPPAAPPAPPPIAPPPSPHRRRKPRRH